MPTDETPTEADFSPSPPRRDDIEIKQQKIARFLTDSGCEGLLLLEPANFRWLTSGAAVKGLYHDDLPALFVNAYQRWLLCSNLDTQRFFDEELDGLGFQVKEWPWHGNREQFLTDLVFGRKIVCDQNFRDCRNVSVFLEQERRRLSPFEQEWCRELGRVTAHAIEATARNLEPGDTEQEVAGHLAHRLLRHGAEPVSLRVAADERARNYRRAGSSETTIRTYCVLQATAAKFGLFVTASRSVCFEAPDERLRQEFDLASRLQAYWFTSIKPLERAGALANVARNFLKNTPYEHEWRLSSPGWFTGRAPVELSFHAGPAERFLEGALAVWQAQVGAATVCDTYLLQENGWSRVTPVEEWPERRYVIQGTRIESPDLLIEFPSAER